jgi:hypothetical protein
VQQGRLRVRAHCGVCVDELSVYGAVDLTVTRVHVNHLIAGTISNFEFLSTLF